MIANATRSILILLLLNIISIGAFNVLYVLDDADIELLRKYSIVVTGDKVTVAGEDKCRAIKKDEKTYLYVHKEADASVVEKKVFPFELVGFPVNDYWWSLKCQTDTDEIKFIVTFKGEPFETTIEIMKKGKTVKLAVPYFKIVGEPKRRISVQATLEAGKGPVFVRINGESHVTYIEGKFVKTPNAVTCESLDCAKFMIEPELKGDSKSDLVATTYLISHDTGDSDEFFKGIRCPVAKVTVGRTKCSYKNYGKGAKDLTSGQTALIEFKCGDYEDQIELKCDNADGRMKLSFRGTKAAAPAKLPAATEGPQVVRGLAKIPAAAQGKTT